MFYRTADGKGYYLFGKSATTVSNSVNSYDAGTHTWALVTPKRHRAFGAHGRGLRLQHSR